MKLIALATAAAKQCLSVFTPGEMTAADQLLLMAAIRKGCGKYFDRVPDRFKTKSLGVRMGGSSTGTATVTVDSAVVTFSGVTPADGATVVIAGDSIENIALAQPDGGGWKLQFTYGGTSSGAKSVTVYKDVAVLPWDIAAISDRVFDQGVGEYFPFVEVPVGDTPIGGNMSYRLEQAGQSTVLRLVPAPTAAVALNLTVEIANIAPAGLRDISSDGATLPIAEDHCSRFVLPFIAEALMTHPLWRNPEAARATQIAAASAEADMKLIRSRVSSEANSILTPFP